MAVRPIRVFYFVADAFPAWRVDLVELFCVQLRDLGVETVWSTRRKDAGWIGWREMQGQRAVLPVSLGSSLAGRMLNRLLEPLTEFWLFLRLLVGERFDVIQVRDDRYTAAFFAMAAARLRDAQFTYWMSFPFPDNDLEMARSTSHCLRRWFLTVRGRMAHWWLFNVVLRAADHVFVQSERMRDHVAARGIDIRKLTPVPMGVPPRLLSGDISANPKAVVPGRIVYLGTLSRSRRLEVMIDAFALVRNRFSAATLIIVGEGDASSERRDLERYVDKVGIGNSVTFTGFLPIQEAWDIARSGAVCVSAIAPSPVFDLGSPTKLVEYMALGRPVVANMHPDQTLVVRASGAGILVEWSAESFADGILAVLESRVDVTPTINQGREWVRENRSYKQLAALVKARLVALTASEGCRTAEIPKD